MGQPARKRATYDDILAAPDHIVAEIIDGQLSLHPRPGILHARSAARLGGMLFDPFDRGRSGPGGWIILDEPALHLGAEPDILVPDAAGWRRERLAQVPDVPFLTLAPDWACEIVSASTAAIDRGRKRRIYAREDVSHLWLIDPNAKTLEIYALAAGQWTELATHEGDVVVRAAPFDAVELELGLLWER